MIRGRLNPALLVAPKDENWGRGGPRRVRGLLRISFGKFRHPNALNYRTNLVQLGGLEPPTS
jgi:hypothetical protein